MECECIDCLFNIDDKCTRQNKEDMTALEKWKSDFKGFISELSMPRDDYNGIMEYIDEVPIEALEEQNAKLKEAIEKMDEWVHSGNRGNCDYFIVDQVEEIINGLKKDGTVSE